MAMGRVVINAQEAFTTREMTLSSLGRGSELFDKASFIMTAFIVLRIKNLQKLNDY